VPTAEERWDLLTSLNLSSITKRICLGSPPLQEEIVEAINDLSFGKLPGTNSLTADFLKLCVLYLVHIN